MYSVIYYLFSVLGNGVIISDSIQYLGGSQPQDKKADMDSHAIGNDRVRFCRPLVFPCDWRYNALMVILFSTFIEKFYISGIIYDVIVEPPSVGSTTDENGHSRPVRAKCSKNIFMIKDCYFFSYRWHFYHTV